MKCPKCGYLGFESSNRCRNCGYDFSLVAPAPAVPEVLIHSDATALGPPPDLSLDNTARVGASLDLDRLIGVPAPVAPDLPLFGDEQKGVGGRFLAGREKKTPDRFLRQNDDLPLITRPSPPRAPLAVRRATPDVPRARPRPPRPQNESLALEPPPMAALGIGRPTAERGDASAAPLSRAMAALLDLTMVLAVDVGVLYFTLRLCGLPLGDLLRLPKAPVLAFFLLLNGGYFVAFTAVGGQSIGKMALGIKVVSQENRPVAVGDATLRTLAYLVSVLPLGLGFLPAMFGREGRALHDRIARTRVIKPSSL